LDKPTLANVETKNNLIGGALADVALEKDPVKQAAGWTTAMQKLVAEGTIQPQEAAPYPGSPDGVQHYVNLHKTADQLIKQTTAGAAQTRADAAKTTSDREKLQADIQNASTKLGTAKDQATYQATYDALPAGIVRQGGFPAPEQWTPATSAAVLKLGMTPDQQVTTGATAARDASNLAHQGVMENQGAARLGLERTRVALEAARNGTAGGDPLAGRSGADLTRLKLVAAGELPPLQSRNPQAQKAEMDAVIAIDPTYTQARYKTVQNFKTAGDSNSIVRLSTALAHLDQATTNSVALGYSPTQSLNVTAAQRRFHTDVDFLTGEAGTLVKQGILTEGEAARIRGNLTSAFQATRAAGLDELGRLINGKVEGIAQKFKTGTGMDIPRSFFDKPTQQRMRQFGIGADDAAPALVAPPAGTPAPQPTAGGQTLTLPAAGAPAAPQPAAAPPPAKLAGAFKQIAYGPGGQQIGSNDGGVTWFDATSGKKYKP
jgi:hypothetical protein